MGQATIKERVAEFIHYKRLKMCEFEALCGLSSGYIASMRKGFGSGKLNNVLRAFPDLNRDWLLYGEGDMLAATPTVQQTNVNGDNNATHTINNNGDVAAFLALLSKKEDSLAKAQEHIDRLLAIIEKMQMP